MITTHVLDLGSGVPAAGVGVVLDVRRGDRWERVSSGSTDERGRLSTSADRTDIAPGAYRLTFDTGAYHRARGVTPFFPEVQIVFDVPPGSEHVHVPLLISPFGYSTYRGS